MNLSELREYIENLKWDDDFMPFYHNALSGMSDDVFDLFVLRYLDHDCTNTYIDFELLKYCAEHNHELANNLLTLCNWENDLDNCKRKILFYYKTKSQIGNLRQLWLLGFCYVSFGFEYSVSIETENAFGPSCMVGAFECFKRCADSDFHLGILYAFYFCDNPNSYNIAIKNNEALLKEYKQKIKELHI